MSIQYPNPGNSEYSSWSYPSQEQTQVTPIPRRAPGWYADPSQPWQRWWDGTEWWTGSVAPTPPPAATPSQPSTVVNSSTVVAVGGQKSVGVAFILTFLFGPLGMLYSTVLGAFFMMFVTGVGAFLIGVGTFGLGLLVWGPACWLISIIWGCAAASGSGTHVVATQSTHQL